MRPRILFGDDNVMIHTKYSHELFEAMVPLEKHWVGQASLAALHRVENVDVMARSGCRALFIGFESVDDGAVRHAGKKQNKPHKYAEVVRCLSDHGIAVWGSFIFGLDDDSPDAFERTVEFCIEAKVTMALFALLTPYPGTAPLQAPEGRGPHHEGRLVAEQRPRYRLAFLPTGDHVARGPACRLGAGLAIDVFDVLDPPPLRLRPETLVDPERGLLAAQPADARASGEEDRRRRPRLAQAPYARPPPGVLTPSALADPFSALQRRVCGNPDTEVTNASSSVPILSVPMGSPSAQLVS